MADCRARGRRVVFPLARAGVQGGDVVGTDNGEVPPVQGGHVGQLEPFGDCDDRSVDRAEWQVGVGAHELGHTRQVGSSDINVLELACSNRGQEGRLDVGSLFQQPAHFDDHRGGDQQRALGGFQQGGTAGMVLVGAVDGRHERAGSATSPNTPPAACPVTGAFRPQLHPALGTPLRAATLGTSYARASRPRSTSGKPGSSPST